MIDKELDNIVSRLILIDIQDPHFLLKYNFAGYILFYKDIDQSINGWRKLRELNNFYKNEFKKIHKSNMIVSIDQEGGVVFRFDYPDFPAIVSQFVIQNQNDAYLMSKLNGLILRYLGFNLNFSPVMDVNINKNNPVIGVRSFGEDFYKVAYLSREYIRGYSDAGILSCGKHFPGHGNTDIDSHLDLPYSILQNNDLYPFIFNKSLLPSIMTAHVVYRNIDYLPATISKKTLDLFLPFQGLVFSDALNMKALQNYDLQKILINSIIAGVDILLILGEDKIKEESIKILVSQAQKDKHFYNLILSKYLKINKCLSKIDKYLDTYNENNHQADSILKEIEKLKSWMFSSFKLPIKFKGQLNDFKKILLNSKKITLILISNKYLKTIRINNQVKDSIKQVFNFINNENQKIEFIEFHTDDNLENSFNKVNLDSVNLDSKETLIFINLVMDNSWQKATRFFKNRTNLYFISFSNPYIEGDFVLNVSGFSRRHILAFKDYLLGILKDKCGLG